VQLLGRGGILQNPDRTHSVGIEVTATANDCNGILRFSDKGDSGAALVTSGGILVGLHFARDSGNVTKSRSCHIRPVLDALKAMAITTANPVHGNPAAVGMRADVPALIDGRPNRTADLRAAFYRTS
jgi:hypothetical protein